MAGSGKGKSRSKENELLEALKPEPGQGAAAPKKKFKRKDDVSGNKWQLSLVVDSEVKNEKDLIRECKIDIDEWRIDRWVCERWEVAGFERATGSSKNWSRNYGGFLLQPLHLVKAWLTRKIEVIAARTEIEDLKKQAKLAVPAPSKLVAPRKTNTGNILIFNPIDHHFGKMAWAQETGWRDYDTKIASADFENSADKILSGAHGLGFDRIVFVIGNDILHIDNRSGTTESGTAMDRDSRYHKIFRTARDVVRRQVVRMEQVVPVDLVIVPGNHDRNAAWHLGDSLEIAFEKHKHVTVDNRPTARKYMEWGRCMWMWTHGDKSKRRGERLPGVMLSEQPEMCGRTRYREIHLGHFHTEQTQEINGTIIRVLPSLSAVDAWHAENEYVGNHNRSNGFIFNRDTGLTGMIVYTVPQ